MEDRVERALTLARGLLAEHELQERIRHEVTDGMEKQQREFLLRQQMAAIRRELGEVDDEDLVERYRARHQDSMLARAASFFERLTDGEFATHAEAVSRFTIEARASFKIKSEHVARVIDVDSLPDGTLRRLCILQL